jgi:DNA-binding transcriptional MocR family regulator
VILTNGAQGALLLLLEHLVGNNGLLLSETLTYTPLDKLAARMHVRIQGVAIDEEGVVAEAFDAACRSARPRALYCNPTIHNPTTATMSMARRVLIAEIARKHGVSIIEDDPLGCLHPEAPPPIAALAPDICWCVISTTKCLAHGLRIAYVVGPSGEGLEKFLEPIRGLSHWFPSALSAALLTQWIESGVADEIAHAIRSELTARQKIAATILHGADILSPSGAMHLWLRLRPDIARAEFVEDLAQHGVRVRPADLFAVDGASPVPNAVRLSLSTPPDQAQVEAGLRIVAHRLEVLWARAAHSVA